MNEEEEKPYSVIIAEAVEKAKKAFQKHLEDEYNLDPAYWSLRIVVRSTSSDFTEFLNEYIYDDKGSYGKETE